MKTNPSRFLHKAALLIGVCFLTVGLDGCQKSEVDPLPELIDPANASLLSRVLVMPTGTQTQSGDAPQPSTGSNVPVATSNSSSLISSNGSTVPLSYSYRNVTGTLAGFYVQVVGSDRYFRVPFSGTSTASGRVSLPIGLPTNVTEGQFRVAFCVYDNNDRVSAPALVTVNVLRLGTGAIQVSLSWDTATDQDLYVTDPGGETIYFGNDASTSNGQLDRDDIDGFGPENIFWTTNAPDGRYVVKVNDYENSSGTNNFYVTVSYPDGSRSFTGTTSRGSTANVTTFTKTGNSIAF